MNRYLILLLFYFTGCSKLISTNDSNSKPIEYHGRVKTIIKKNCLNCHSKNSRADYLLLSKYSDLIKNKENIIKWLADKRMPPYDFNSDLPRHRFLINEVTPLLDFERQLLISFLKRPILGKAKHQELAKNEKVIFSDKEEPGFPFSFGSGVPLAPRKATYKCYLIKIPKRFIGKYLVGHKTPKEKKISNSRNVHHFLVSVSQISSSKELNENPSESCYHDGSIFSIYNESNNGVRIKKGDNLVIQVHYDRTMDKSFSKEYTLKDFQGFVKVVDKVEYESLNYILNVNNAFIDIPYGKESEVSTELAISKLTSTYPDFFNSNAQGEAAKLSSFYFHMHKYGKSAKLETLTVKKSESSLIFQKNNYSKRFNFGIVIKKPLSLEGIEKLKLSCLYDNTPTNPYVILNNSSKSTIFGGMTGNDEMCLIAFNFLKKIN